MRGRKLIVLNDEQVANVDWSETNDVVSEMLGLSVVTVCRLRKVHGKVGHGRGRPVGSKKQVMEAVV